LPGPSLHSESRSRDGAWRRSRPAYAFPVVWTSSKVGGIDLHTEWIGISKAGQTYISERASPNQRRWTDKDPAEKRAVYATRRRTKGSRGKELSRQRSELTERSCDTGVGRQTPLRGLESVTKRHLMTVAARNLSVIMRAIIGIGGPRSLQGLRKLLQTAWTHFDRLLSAMDRLVAALGAPMTQTSRAIGG